jgi:adenylate kinase family enzyme
VQRILVYGVTGSGKSTLARRIGERTGLTYHSIDDLTWEPNWSPVPDAVQREIITKLCDGDEWVIDSAYATWADIPLARVDLIVGLDLPRWLSYGRLVRRTVGHIVRHESICNGNYATWRNQFGRESLLWFHVGSFSRKRRRMRAWQADPAMPPVVLLRSRAEAERWLDGLGAGQS